MQPRKSLGGFSPPQQPQQQQQQSQQPPGTQVSEPASSQQTDQTQVPKGWLGLGTPATGLLSLLKPSAGSQQGQPEAVQNRERTLDWLHASNLMRMGQGGSQPSGASTARAPKDGPSSSRSLAAKAFQNSYRSRLDPQLSDRSGAPFDGPTAGWNYPGSEADASDVDDASTDAGSDAEQSVADDHDRDSAKDHGSRPEREDAGHLESLNSSGGTGMARQGSIRTGRTPSAVQTTPFSTAPDVSGSPDVPRSAPMPMERAMSKRMSFKIDLTNVKANMSRGQGGALSPTLMSPATSCPLTDSQAAPSKQAERHQDDDDNSDDGDGSASGPDASALADLQAGPGIDPTAVQRWVVKSTLFTVYFLSVRRIALGHSCCYMRRLHAVCLLQADCASPWIRWLTGEIAKCKCFDARRGYEVHFLQQGDLAFDKCFFTPLECLPAEQQLTRASCWGLDIKRLSSRLSSRSCFRLLSRILDHLSWALCMRINACLFSKCIVAQRVLCFPDNSYLLWVQKWLVSLSCKCSISIPCTWLLLSSGQVAYHLTGPACPASSLFLADLAHDAAGHIAGLSLSPRLQANALGHRRYTLASLLFFLKPWTQIFKTVLKPSNDVLLGLSCHVPHRSVRPGWRDAVSIQLQEVCFELLKCLSAFFCHGECSKCTCCPSTPSSTACQAGCVAV